MRKKNCLRDPTDMDLFFLYFQTKMGVKKRPRCFFDVTISGTRVGRVIFELFSDITPITCENFRGLCTGEKGLGKKTGKKGVKIFLERLPPSPREKKIIFYRTFEEN